MHTNLWQDVPADRQAEATTLLADIQKELGELEAVIEGKTNKAVAAKKRVVLQKMGNLEQLMVQSFPYEYVYVTVSLDMHPRNITHVC
jgi:peptidylprolyl isomerase